MPVPVVAMTDSAIDRAMALAQKPPPRAWATAMSAVPFSEAAGSLAREITPWKPSWETV